MPNTPQQQRRTDRIESILGLATPVLNLVLAAGDRFSRIVAPPEEDQYAIRPAGERLELAELRATSPAARRQPEA
jgi:hypothetical protein